VVKYFFAGDWHIKSVVIPTRSERVVLSVAKDHISYNSAAGAGNIAGLIVASMRGNLFF
jgi:hypothetical protein